VPNLPSLQPYSLTGSTGTVRITDKRIPTCFYSLPWRRFTAHPIAP